MGTAALSCAFSQKFLEKAISVSTAPLTVKLNTFKGSNL